MPQSERDTLPDASVQANLAQQALAMLQNKRVLVTGGAGYLGTRLSELLADKCDRVVRLGRPGSTFPPGRGQHAPEQAEADVRAASVWERVLEGVDVVFHLAAQTSAYTANADPRADYENNVRPVINLLETCRRYGYAPVVVFSSTVTIVGVSDRLPVDESHADRPSTVYDRHKRMAEDYLERYARDGILQTVSLRLANVYGPGPRSNRPDRGILNQMVARALAGEAITVFGAGNHLRDYVYIDDVCRAFVLGAAHATALTGRYFVIATGRGYAVSDAFHLVAERVAARTGRVVDVRHVQPRGKRLDIENRDFAGDSSRFRVATGWEPEFALTDGIDKTIDAWCKPTARA